MRSGAHYALPVERDTDPRWPRRIEDGPVGVNSRGSSDLDVRALLRGHIDSNRVQDLR